MSAPVERLSTSPSASWFKGTGTAVWLEKLVTCETAEALAYSVWISCRSWRSWRHCGIWSVTASYIDRHTPVLQRSDKTYRKWTDNFKNRTNFKINSLRRTLTNSYKGTVCWTARKTPRTRKKQSIHSENPWKQAAREVRDYGSNDDLLSILRPIMGWLPHSKRYRSADQYRSILCIFLHIGHFDVEIAQSHITSEGIYVRISVAAWRRRRTLECKSHKSENGQQVS